MNSPTKTYQRTAKRNQCDHLILENIDYVGRILSTMTIAVHTEDERENLHAAGVLGLVEAANKFDPTHNVAFRTFAFRRIQGAIIDELRKIAPVSQQVLQQIGVLKKAHEVLEPPVTPEALAGETGMSLEVVTATLEAMRFLKPEDWNDFTSIAHGSWKSSSDEPSAQIEGQEMANILAESIAQLPERERLVMTLYFSEELNLKEIGAVLEISESRVSRVLAAAKFRLKEIVETRVR